MKTLYQVKLIRLAIMNRTLFKKLTHIANEIEFNIWAKDSTDAIKQCIYKLSMDEDITEKELALVSCEEVSA